MEDWYKVTLSPAQLAAGAEGRLQDSFKTIFLIAGSPPAAGMFSGLPAASGIIFFSPEAARIARALIELYAGVPCSAPRRSEVLELLSHAGAPEIPFASEA